MPPVRAQSVKGKTATKGGGILKNSTHVNTSTTSQLHHNAEDELSVISMRSSRSMPRQTPEERRHAMERHASHITGHTKTCYRCKNLVCTCLDVLDAKMKMLRERAKKKRERELAALQKEASGGVEDGDTDLFPHGSSASLKPSTPDRPHAHMLSPSPKARTPSKKPTRSTSANHASPAPRGSPSTTRAPPRSSSVFVRSTTAPVLPASKPQLPTFSSPPKPKKKKSVKKKKELLSSSLAEADAKQAMEGPSTKAVNWLLGSEREAASIPHAARFEHTPPNSASSVSSTSGSNESESSFILDKTTIDEEAIRYASERLAALLSDEPEERTGVSHSEGVVRRKLYEAFEVKLVEIDLRSLTPSSSSLQPPSPKFDPRLLAAVDFEETPYRIAIATAERSARVVIAKAMLEFQNSRRSSNTVVVPPPVTPRPQTPTPPASPLGDSFSMKMLLGMEEQQRAFLDSEELQQRNHIVQYVTHVLTSIIWGAANKSLAQPPIHRDPVAPPVHPAVKLHLRSQSPRRAQPAPVQAAPASQFPPYGLGIVKGLFTVMTNPMACCRRFQVTPPDSPRESIEALPTPPDSPRAVVEEPSSVPSVPPVDNHTHSIKVDEEVPSIQPTTTPPGAA